MGRGEGYSSCSRGGVDAAGLFLEQAVVHRQQSGGGMISPWIREKEGDSSGFFLEQVVIHWHNGGRGVDLVLEQGGVDAAAGGIFLEQVVIHKHGAEGKGEDSCKKVITGAVDIAFYDWITSV